jgi:hypothetical protein
MPMCKGDYVWKARFSIWTDPSCFAAFVRKLHRHEWVVYSKPPFGGPDHVLQYLVPLHPSRCHLQSSDSLGHRIRSPVPVEGLCESQQEAHDDPHRRRVPSPISTACLAERVSAAFDTSGGWPIGNVKSCFSFAAFWPRRRNRRPALPTSRFLRNVRSAKKQCALLNA